MRRSLRQDAVEFKNFLTRNRKKLASFMPVLETPFEKWSDLLRPEMMKLLPLMKPWLSLDGDLRKHFKDERIRLGFSFQSKYLGMSPFRCPSLFSILSFLEYEHGVFHPDRRMRRGDVGDGAHRGGDGCRGLDGGAGRGDFDRRRPASRGKAVGVRTSKRRLQADAVVVNADFAEAMRRLIPNRHRRKWSDKKIASKKYSCSTFMMYLGIEGRYDDVAHHTIYLAENYRQNLRDIEELHELSENPSFYVQNASVTDSTLAPKGHSTLYVLLPVTHESAKVDWARERAGFRELAIEQMKRIGIEDVERRIRTERIVTPEGWRDEFGLLKGATFSMKHSLNQMLHLRPHNRFEDVDGIYLTGGGTHPGSGLPVIFQSARISSKLLLEDLDIEPRWSTSSEIAMENGMMQVAS